MVYLFLVASLLLVVLALWTSLVTRQRVEDVLDHVRSEHPEYYEKNLATHGRHGKAMVDFLRSNESLGDERLAALKKSAQNAASIGPKPLIIVLGLMVVLYVAGAVLGLIQLE